MFQNKAPLIGAFVREAGAAAVAAPVADMCQETCRYFPFCGGGPPGNKFFENGDFATTETLSCRLHKKATFDVALDKLEQMKAEM